MTVTVGDEVSKLEQHGPYLRPGRRAQVSGGLSANDQRQRAFDSGSFDIAITAILTLVRARGSRERRLPRMPLSRLLVGVSERENGRLAVRRAADL